MQQNIAIIGGGNLGSAIAEGVISSQFAPADCITVTKRNISTLQYLQQHGVQITNDNVLAAKQSKYIVLAIKPFQIKEVLQQLQPHLQSNHHVLISVVTGVWIKEMRETVGHEIPIVRAMPNTAIAIKESMTCLCSEKTNQQDNEFVQQLFATVGKTVFIEENLMDAATVLAACGTAYAMRFIRANIQGGIEIGFSAKVASLIAAQTVKGAAELLLQKNTHPEQEIDKVTTPKGCTIAGLNEMEHQGFSSSLIKGIVTSYKKIKEDM
jgi:pyrroline-5-carboxylate reductase